MLVLEVSRLLRECPGKKARLALPTVWLPDLWGSPLLTCASVMMVSPKNVSRGQIEEVYDLGL
jgi:hypothetical protein